MNLKLVVGQWDGLIECRGVVGIVGVLVGVGRVVEATSSSLSAASSLEDHPCLFGSSPP